LGFYQNASSGRKQVSWFIAEDITEDNSCFDVIHWSYDSSNYIIYASGTKYFSYYHTFFIVSGAGGHTSNADMDRSALGLTMSTQHVLCGWILIIMHILNIITAK
jgi:hypothetical protein